MNIVQLAGFMLPKYPSNEQLLALLVRYGLSGAILRANCWLTSHMAVLYDPEATSWIAKIASDLLGRQPGSPDFVSACFKTEPGAHCQIQNSKPPGVKYSWSAPGSRPSTGDGEVFDPVYATAGTYVVTVKGCLQALCTEKPHSVVVTVGGEPPAPDTQSPQVEIPPQLERYRGLIEDFQRARAANDVAGMRSTFATDALGMANWGGAGTGARVPLNERNLRLFLDSGITAVGIRQQVGAGQPLQCASCPRQPAYGLLLRGLQGKSLVDVGHGAQRDLIFDDIFQEDAALLVFEATGRPDLTTGKFFGLAVHGPFELVTVAPGDPPPTSAPRATIQGEIDAINAAAAKIGTAHLVDGNNAPDCPPTSKALCIVRLTALPDSASRGTATLRVGNPGREGETVVMGRNSDGGWGFVTWYYRTSRPWVLPSTFVVCPADGLNVREGPSTNSAILATLAPRTGLRTEEFVLTHPGFYATDVGFGGWYRLSSPRSGWVVSQFVASTFENCGAP